MACHTESTKTIIISFTIKLMDTLLNYQMNCYCDPTVSVLYNVYGAMKHHTHQELSHYFFRVYSFRKAIDPTNSHILQLF